MSEKLNSSDSDRSSDDEVLLAEELNAHFVQDDDDDFEEYLKNRDDMLRVVGTKLGMDKKKEPQMKGTFSNDGSGFLPHENTSSSTTTIGFGNDGSSSSFPRQKTNVLSIKKKRKKNTTSSGSISSADLDELGRRIKDFHRHSRAMHDKFAGQLKDAKKENEDLNQTIEDYKKKYERCKRIRSRCIKQINIADAKLEALREWVRDMARGEQSPYPPEYEIWGLSDSELQGGRKSRKKKRKKTRKKSRRKKRKKTRKKR